jgi:ubiquinone/menaquinone biosynthesis C-methylase UbiE
VEKDYATEADRKLRWAGILEYPIISRVIRQCLDGFKIESLSRIISPYPLEEVLDVCCGTGEYSRLGKWKYTGLDNSHSFIEYAQRKYKYCRFVQGDAMQMPFGDNTFDAVLFACASHHFPEEAFGAILEEMRRISRKYIIVDNAVTSESQGLISTFMYGLDRGTMYRIADHIEQILQKLTDAEIIQKETYRSFPGIYLHAVFILEIII